MRVGHKVDIDDADKKKLLVKVMQVVPIIGCLGSHKQVVVVENLEIQV